jgi:hypothetical protein
MIASVSDAGRGVTTEATSLGTACGSHNRSRDSFAPAC